MSFVIALILLIAGVAFDEPIFDNATIVTGGGVPGSVATLRVIQRPEINKSAPVDNGGRFVFVLDAPLEADYVAQVQSAGRVNYALVKHAASQIHCPVIIRHDN